MTFIVNQGRELAGVPDASIDFVWSYDVVDIAPRDMEAYFGEVQRVLRPGARAGIHHAGRRHSYPSASCARRLSAAVCTDPTTNLFVEDNGWRSDVSRALARRLARRQGLRVEAGSQQVDHEFGVPRFRDAISILRRPE